jgi:hypothetical protein
VVETIQPEEGVPMCLRRIVILAVAVALTFTTGFAVEAGGGKGKGKILKLDSAANVVVLEDGTMYRMVPDTVILVEEKPVKFETLKPGVAVVIQSGEAVQLKDGQYIIISPSASPASR